MGFVAELNREALYGRSTNAAQLTTKLRPFLFDLGTYCQRFHKKNGSKRCVNGVRYRAVNDAR